MTRTYPIIAGVVAGVLGSLAVGALRGEPKPVAVASAPAPRERAPAPAVAPPGWEPYLRMGAVEARLGAVEERVSALADAGPRPGAPPSEPALTRPRDERRQEDYERLVAEHQAEVDAHYRERADPATSGPRVAAIRDGLGGLAPSSHFEVAGVDCRTESCVADLVFAHPADALRAQRDLIAAPGPNGGRSIAFPEPTGDGEYRATLYYAIRP